MQALFFRGTYLLHVSCVSHRGAQLPTLSRPKMSTSVSVSLGTTLPLYIKRMRSVAGLLGTASCIRWRSSLMVVDVGRSGRLTPPSTSVDGERILRLTKTGSSAMVFSERTAGGVTVVARCSSGPRFVYVALRARDSQSSNARACSLQAARAVTRLCGYSELGESITAPQLLDYCISSSMAPESKGERRPSPALQLREPRQEPRMSLRTSLAAESCCFSQAPLRHSSTRPCADALYISAPISKPNIKYTKWGSNDRHLRPPAPPSRRPSASPPSAPTCVRPLIASIAQLLFFDALPRTTFPSKRVFQIAAELGAQEYQDKMGAHSHRPRRRLSRSMATLSYPAEGEAYTKRGG